MNISLPGELAELLRDACLSEDTVGESDAHVFLVETPGQPNRYLKVSSEALEEKHRLDWLRGKLPVPEVLYFGQDTRHQYLLLSKISGWMAFDEAFRPNLNALVKVVAQGLRDIHSIPITDCPFDHRLSIKMVAAQSRLQGRMAESLYAELLALRPEDEDLVFTHGDYCLPNIIIDPQAWRINGFIDWGSAGIADRYLDLALAARSFIRNFGPEWVLPFFTAYGIETIDHKRVKFYQLLTNLF